MNAVHILTIGWLPRNKFWGETENRLYHDFVCTSTLIRGKINVVVDPSMPPEQMAKVLYDRSGLRPDAIDAVFITHAHGDHFTGIEVFERADWFMNKIEIGHMKIREDSRSRELASRFLPVAKGVMEDIEPILLPGHTEGITGLFFDSIDGKVMVCGDIVMSRDFFNHREGYYNAVDQEKSRESILTISEIADIVIPGHDNYFYIRH
jgi:glyoxylase-like metal-dependent hydrolase (beta-lactamase superfamily II)